MTEDPQHLTPLPPPPEQPLQLKRLNHWRGRFTQALIAENHAYATKGLIWGKNDCLVGFANNVVDALTGVKPFDICIGCYDSATTAVSALKRVGLEDLADLMSKVFPVLDHPSKAMRGDLVCIPDPTRSGLKYIIGTVDHVYVTCPSAESLVQISRDHIVSAYQVGERPSV